MNKSLDYGLYVVESRDLSEKAVQDFILNSFNHQINVLKEDVCFLGQDFLVENADALYDWHSRVGEGKRVGVVAVNNFNIASQNKLLKIFEEPQKDTHFIIFTKNKNKLLKTILSRALLIRSDKEIVSFAEASSNRRKNKLDLEAFLKSSLQERIDLAEKVAKDYKDEKVTKEEIGSFLNNLEKNARDNKNKNLEKIVKIKSYLDYPGSSVKILLQTIAFLA